MHVPIETEEYLSYRYGEDWNISKRDWIISKDNGAIIGIGIKIPTRKSL